MLVCVENTRKKKEVGAKFPDSCLPDNARNLDLALVDCI
jgi:hypothetical protein